MLDLTQPRTVHLIGIGGAGMSGLARILLQRGHIVRGSDLRESRQVADLRALGAIVLIGHAREHLDPQTDAVVVSTAVRLDNPELELAKGLGLVVLHRADLLAALMQTDRRALIAGTHGKTTTTAMTVVAMQAAGLDPSFAVGGQLNEVGTNAHAGEDGWFVAEADESDRSLLRLDPEIAVITNAELDHPDEFDGADDVHGVFVAFLERLPADGLAILCHDDAGAMRLRDVAPRVLTYGQDPAADLHLIVGEGGGATIRFEDREFPIDLSVPGLHNRLNATAAMAVCHAAGLDLDAIAQGLGRFRGTARRFQELGNVRGVRVVDDYAHHPTELAATLAAARQVHDGRIVVVVQPHRFSRTRILGAELGRAAAAADHVVVTDVYAASESPEPGVTGALVADAARDAGARVTWVPHLAEVAETVCGLVASGDLLLVTGAGDVNQVGPDVLSRLRGA